MNTGETPDRTGIGGTIPPSISVVGLGKLGAPMAACFASRGFQVIGLDTNEGYVRLLNEGHAPVYEPGLEEKLQSAEGRLSATQDYHTAVMNSDITFVIVPTPSEEAGGFSLKFVLDACGKIGDALREKPGYHLVAVTSTVLPGALDNEVLPLLEARSGKKCGERFGLCYSPEFIALGTVIRDFLNPDFLLIGESDPAAGEKLAGIYRRVVNNDPPIARMRFVEAELTKIAVNTFITTKLTFANMLSRICERLPGADVDVVTSALGLDSRIGPKYLKGALGYGGPCFPRDNVALSYLARTLGVPALLAEATDAANRQEVCRLTALVKSKLPDSGVAGILGLSYKPNTNVVEQSQGLLLAKALAEDGIRTVVYDPAAIENARQVLNGQVKYAASTAECVEASDVLIITTPWEEFRQIQPRTLERSGTRRSVVDCWRILDRAELTPVAEYTALGTGTSEWKD